MPLVAIELLPLKGPWEENPAEGRIVPDVQVSDLTPLNLAWREHWTEAFLASQARAIPDCLGELSADFIVWRQVADMDLVYMNESQGRAILIELKKQRGSNAKDALCQLARNLSNARRVLAARGLKTIRTAICGEWSTGQIDRARSAIAWKYLVDQGTDPAVVLHAGARGPDGRQYFLLDHESPPISRKGKRTAPAWLRALQVVARTATGTLPTGLRLQLYRAGSLLVLACTADSRVRDKYLGSRVTDAFDSSINAFLAIEAWLDKEGLKTERLIEQRLEARALLGNVDTTDPAQVERLRQLLVGAARVGAMQ